MAYAAAIFLSAFLLFQVQPMIGKRILPWFGGAPGVWTTCMLFFQVTLLLGYLYAHAISERLRPRAQGILHICLLGLAMLLLPVYPGSGFKPPDPAHPLWRIIALLAATAAVPYFALSATSPLLQRWFTLARPGVSPYRLYAVSNAGSLLALLSYPFLVEPHLALRTQSLIWAGGFILFAILCLTCAMQAFGRAREETALRGQDITPPPAGPAAPAEPLRIGEILLWAGLAFAPSVLLLATTNALCQDVAVVPFMWLLPLSLYLISFILCFEHPRWYFRPVFWPLLAVSVAASCLVIWQAEKPSLLVQAGTLSTALFACCMVCHGEAARRKPGERRLTLFYLLISAGGALGGIFVTLVAPLIFRMYFELHVGIAACCSLAALALWLEARRRLATRLVLRFLCAGALFLASAAPAVALSRHAVTAARGYVSVSRNFYGVLLVWQIDSGDPQKAAFVLGHGRIVHGVQFCLPSKAIVPTSYYGEQSGVGLALRNFPKTGPLRVGVVGLGTATLAAYGRAGDYYRFYEINPGVAKLATEQFTYLLNCPAKYDIVMGDARLSLEREPSQQFDVLVLDAFTSDAIPVHLLTEEAFKTYERHMAPGGVICAHVSNRHLDLTKVLASQAQRSGLSAAVISSDKTDYAMPANWMLLTSNERLLNAPAISAVSETPPASGVRWTDEFSNLFGILRPSGMSWRDEFGDLFGILKD